MNRNLALFGLVMIFSGPALAQEDASVPFTLPTPEGWRTETIPFPFPFAPQIEHTGLEELRFAPGMFEDGSEDFWSYAFVWWIPASDELNAPRLSSELVLYFEGLARAVAKSQDYDPGEMTVEVGIPRLPPTDGTVGFEAEVFDAFVTRAPVKLNGRLSVMRCAAQGRQAVIFEFSPRPPEHGIWETLGTIREEFRCD